MNNQDAGLLHRIKRRNARWGSTFGPWLIALFALLLAPVGAYAQDDAPARVGRIANFGGQLLLAPDDRADQWAPIGLNYPVTGGDNLWVSGEGRAEVDFGAGQVRLAGDTNVHVSRLDDHEISLFIAQGRAIVRLRVLEQGDSATIDTPNTQVVLARPGLYRIDVSDDRQQTTVVVREGEVAVAVSGGMQQILPGQTATLFGIDNVQADVRNGTGLDGFDTWSADRDRYYGRSRSANYVSRQMVGYADLDPYGSWQNYPEYGAVWFPTTVAVGWAPYRHGHWVSLPVWGYTWVDEAPWGYAPFHYGRWAHIGGRWGWCPGTYVARPAWAPALVAWYGGGGWGLSASVGAPAYGWVPLGWREPYVPSWRNCGSRCMTAYNRPYAVTGAERPRQPPTYVNHAVPGAITAVAGATLAAGKPVAPNVVAVPGHLVTSAPVLNAAPPVKPLPVAANLVRPGNGVPPPASTIQATTKPMMNRPDRGGRPQTAPGTAITPAPGRAAGVVQQAPGGVTTAAPPRAGSNAPASANNAAEQSQRTGRAATNAPTGAPGVPSGGRSHAANTEAATSGASVPIPPRGPQTPLAAPQSQANANSAPPGRPRGPLGQDAYAGPQGQGSVSNAPPARSRGPSGESTYAAPQGQGSANSAPPGPGRNRGASGENASAGPPPQLRREGPPQGIPLPPTMQPRTAPPQAPPAAPAGPPPQARGGPPPVAVNAGPPQQHESRGEKPEKPAPPKQPLPATN